MDAEKTNVLLIRKGHLVDKNGYQPGKWVQPLFISQGKSSGNAPHLQFILNQRYIASAGLNFVRSSKKMTI